MVMSRRFPLAAPRAVVSSREGTAMPYRGPLDWLNFFLADVKGALGPYIGIYLLTEQHWNQAAIGFLATVAGIVGLIIHTPFGAFIDATRWKRAAVVAGVGVLTISALAIAIMPSFPVVLTAQTMMAVAGAVFGPAIAAITLGILGSHGLAYRMGRNAAFDHAGNVSVAVLAGAVGWWFAQSAVFYLVPIFSLLAASAVLSIPARAIDHAQARGLDRGQPDSAERPSGWSVLVTCKPLLVFAACVALFHFANAPMLPLVGQKLALQDKNLGTSLMSACIVAAQLVMVPMAMLVGARADAWGHKRLFLLALLALPIRGALYTLSDNKAWLVGVQLLDGIGAGIFGAIFPVIVADLMRNTGRFNVAQGAVITAQSIGAALSTTLAGLVVVKAGYSAAFLTLGAVAALGLAVCWFALPETGERSSPDAARLKQTARPASGIAAE